MNQPSLRFDDIRAKARGSWPEILSSLGIEVDFNRHGPCPGCGGKDRFRFDDKDDRGTWICGGGGETAAGDGFSLFQHVTGCGPREALEAVSRVLGGLRTRSMSERRSPRTSEGQRSKALRMWLAADRSDAAVAAHPYAVRKQIGHAFGAGRYGDLLLLPIRIHGTAKVISVQTVTTDGTKRTYGSMEDGFLMLGNTMRPDGDIFVVEGWADAYAVLHTWTNTCCGIAFGKGRMNTVAKNIVSQYPRKRVVIIEDGGK